MTTGWAKRRVAVVGTHQEDEAVVPHAPRRTTRMLAAAGALVVLLAAGIGGSGAAPGAPTDARSERERVRQERAAAAAELDVLQATNDEVEAALDALNANVAGQEAAL